MKNKKTAFVRFPPSHPDLFSDSALPKGLSTNNLGKIALRFGLDLVAAIEQNRKRSSATLRIL
ncbi:MAG: hypothetical protein K0B01_00610 [Syntrophobacterales bacterium]|nr:hypothetical protein [Syntrophobacterales bacterium]